MERRIFTVGATLALLAVSLLPSGCSSRSGDGDREANAQAYVLEHAPEVAQGASEAMAKVPALGAILALYVPNTATTGDATSLYTLGAPTENQSGISGVLVAGPDGGSFTLTLIAGNTLVREFTGSVTVTFLDGDGEPIVDPSGAADIVAIDVDVDLVGPGELTVAGEIEVELETPGLPIDPSADTVTLSADLGVSSSGEGGDAHGGGEEDGHDHGAEEAPEGDGHDHGDEAAAGAMDLEIEAAVFGFITDPVPFVAEYFASHEEGQTGFATMTYSMSVPQGSRAEGGHVHGETAGAITVEVTVDVDLGAYQREEHEEEEEEHEEGEEHEEHGEHIAQPCTLSGAGATGIFELELEAIEPPAVD